MSLTKMNIPEIINVGYQKRTDTYTGRLAYVVYTDAKGKLRKENSWKSWCEDSIPKDEFKNIPTSGFVLNKGVGGQRESYGWNARNEYIRIYDPRDFEFEISVANLLFILQECSSIKGKGLEGEFVYSWDGAELVLLPCNSEEYKQCKEYTKNQITRVTKDQMIEGHVYQMRNMKNVMYMGKHEWWAKEYSYHHTQSYHLEFKGKKHIFLDLDKDEESNDKYIVETGFTKLAKKITDDIPANFADEYVKMTKGMHCVFPNNIEFTPKEIKQEFLSYWYRSVHAFVKKDNEFYFSRIFSDYNNTKELRLVISRVPFYKNNIVNMLNKKETKFHLENINSYGDISNYDLTYFKTFEELSEEKFYSLNLVNENNYKMILL